MAGGATSRTPGSSASCCCAEDPERPEPRRAPARRGRRARCSATSRTSTRCSPTRPTGATTRGRARSTTASLWGRGAIDMKSQTAAEAVAAAHLARAGWRPARGELKLISVVDEETGGRLGAQWLTEERPDVARVDWLLNEGGGAVMPYGERRLYGVCCAEKGTFRFRVRARGRAGHASVPALADNALLKLLPALERLGARARRLRRRRRAARVPRGDRRGPRRPGGRRRARCAPSSRGSPRCSSRRSAPRSPRR